MKPIRKCRECGLEAFTKDDLPLFKKHKNGKHGHDNICRACHNKQRIEYSKTHSYVSTPEKRLRDREYGVKNRDKRRAYSREYYQLNKDKYRERNRRLISYKDKTMCLAVNPRKGICGHCGKTEQEEGKQLHIHHIEYDDENPSKHIIELCHKCHMKEHYNK